MAGDLNSILVATYQVRGEVFIIRYKRRRFVDALRALGRSMNAVQHVRAKYIKQIKPGYVSRRNKRKDFTFYAPPIKESAE